MTELETMQHAKNYIDKLANGIDPLTDEIINDDSVINNVRISRLNLYTELSKHVSNVFLLTGRGTVKEKRETLEKIKQLFP